MIRALFNLIRYTEYYRFYLVTDKTIGVHTGRADWALAPSEPFFIRG